MMVEHHVGATKNTDVNRELTNLNKMSIKENLKQATCNVFLEHSSKKRGNPGCLLTLYRECVYQLLVLTVGM